MEKGLATSIGVRQRYEGNPARGWSFSVWHGDGADFGTARTETEAWEKARSILRAHGATTVIELPPPT